MTADSKLPVDIRYQSPVIGGQVQCHSGYEYAQRPVTFLWGGARVEVEEIIAGWRDPNGKRFRVRTASNELFELHYNQAEDQWSVQKK